LKGLNLYLYLEIKHMVGLQNEATFLKKTRTPLGLKKLQEVKNAVILASGLASNSAK
jgi:hypothetical protein